MKEFSFISQGSGRIIHLVQKMQMYYINNSAVGKYFKKNRTAWMSYYGLLNSKNKSLFVIHKNRKSKFTFSMNLYVECKQIR